MPDQEYIRNLRTPTVDNPLRILVSACMIGEKCAVDGTSYGEYPSVLKLLNYKTVKLTSFCPEHFSFGTPREMCDIYGGNGLDVLEGRAKVLTSTGIDWTAGMILASEKMLRIAEENKIELAVMMDISAACGNHVIYDGNRYAANKKYQIGMGVCGIVYAQLHKAGFKIISWREFKSLDLLYSKIDPEHIPNPDAKDFDQHEWYLSYFNKK
ncbi:MAG: DUF523 domain-containing protein [Bacteroidetes bacterium]|nr:DUF523 domain-containing protein [Bacteroidota bacterium]